MLKYSVGIDVSMDDLYACFKVCREDFSSKVIASRTFKNTRSGIKDLIRWMESKRKNKDLPFQIGMEATGVYHELLAYTLDSKGYLLSVILPGKVKAYFRSLGIVSKNDSMDADGLASMMLERKWDSWNPPSKEIADLRDKYRFRDKLLCQLTEFKNMKHAQSKRFESNKFIIKSLNSTIKSFEKQLESLEAEITRSLEEQSEFNDKVKKIVDSISGLGKLTVGNIAAELDGFALITSQSQLTSYAGYDIVENQSGRYKGKTKISKRGNRHIRRALYFPAITVVRFEGDIFEQLYSRVYNRTKIKMKGYVAVQRKLLCIIYTLWKNDAAFIKNYSQEEPSESKQVCEIKTPKAA